MFKGTPTFKSVKYSNKCKTNMRYDRMNYVVERLEITFPIDVGLVMFGPSVTNDMNVCR